MSKNQPVATISTDAQVNWKDLVETVVTEMEVELEGKIKQCVTEQKMLEEKLKEAKDAVIVNAVKKAIEIAPGWKSGNNSDELWIRSTITPIDMSYSVNLIKNNVKVKVELPLSLVDKEVINNYNSIYNQIQQSISKEKELYGIYKDIPKLTKQVKAATLQKAILKNVKGKEILDYFRDIRDKVVKDLIPAETDTSCCTGATGCKCFICSSISK